MKQRSPEWFQARQGKITGSRVAAVLGLCMFQSRESLMRQMVREWYGCTPDFTGNIATRWGEDHEVCAKQAYEADTGHFVDQAGLIHHPTHEFLAASPDGLINDDGCLEIKCPYSARKTGEFKPLDDQSHYHAQIQLVLTCCQRQWCDAFFWSPVAQRRNSIVADPHWLPGVIDTLAAFHREFEAIISSKTLSAPFLEDRKVIMDSPEWQAAAEEYRQCQREKQALDKRLAEVRQRLLDQCTCEKTHYGAGVKAVPSYRSRFDKTALAKDYSELDLNKYYRKDANLIWSIKEHNATDNS